MRTALPNVLSVRRKLDRLIWLLSVYHVFQTLQILIRWKVFREYHFGMCSIRSGSDDIRMLILFTGNQKYHGGSEVASRKWHGDFDPESSSHAVRLIFGICGGYQMLGETLK